MCLGDGQDDAKASPKDCLAGLYSPGWNGVDTLVWSSPPSLLSKETNHHFDVEGSSELRSATCGTRDIDGKVELWQDFCWLNEQTLFNITVICEQVWEDCLGTDPITQIEWNEAKWWQEYCVTLWIQPCDNVNQWEVSGLTNKLVYRACKTGDKSSCTALVAEETRPSVHV